MGHFSLIIRYGQEEKMISIGIDTHERMHSVRSRRRDSRLCGMAAYPITGKVSVT